MRYGWWTPKEGEKKNEQWNYCINFIIVFLSHSFDPFSSFWNKYLKSRNLFIFGYIKSFLFARFACVKIKSNLTHYIDDDDDDSARSSKKKLNKIRWQLKNISYYLFQYCVLYSLLLTIKFWRADAFSFLFRYMQCKLCTEWCIS